jgi:GNAT superfamily N-acetyltransferase
MENYVFRKATIDDLEAVLFVINKAKERMKSHMSGQWQDGSPSKETFVNDINEEHLYVLTTFDKVICVLALLDHESAYDTLLSGEWLHNLPYKVIHRFAVHEDYLGKGVASFMLKSAELQAKSEGIRQVRIDTHERNVPMVKLLLKNGYVQCGSTLIEGTKLRIVFEKVI